MAQFDYYRRPGGDGFLLDCQTEFMAHFDTRMVVPLLPLPLAPVPARRLNPLFIIDEEVHSMVTQFAATIQANELREPVGSLESHHLEIIGAFDFLLTGV